MSTLLTADATLADKINEIIEIHGLEAFEDYIDYAGGVEYAAESFEDAYEGQWDSLEAFAWNLLDEIYPELPTIPGIRMELDMIGWNCDYSITDNGHVFRSV